MDKILRSPVIAKQLYGTNYNIFYVYIIENLIDKSWYTGYTTNLKRRISEHNSGIGGSYSSKKSGQWRIIYFEAYLNKLDALGRERYLKSGSGKKFIQKQLRHYFDQMPT